MGRRVFKGTFDALPVSFSVTNMREGWTIQVGAVEELEDARTAKWAEMCPNERVDALLAFLDAWKGPGSGTIERTYRIVSVPLPPGMLAKGR